MGLVPTGTGKLIAVFDHVTIRASDRVASERFYDSLLRTLGIERMHSGEALAEWDDFSLAPQTRTTRPRVSCTSASLHLRAGDNGAPGERPEYHPGYCSAYVLDPDGNNVEVVNHNR
jgi:catechol 2,3-dioxygenase-like lactoylglutathione lyase family enzyme